MGIPREEDRMAMFEDFEFDKDKRWVEFKSRLDIPGDEAVALPGIKAKWYKKHVDPNFDSDKFVYEALKKDRPNQADLESKVRASQGGGATAPRAPSAAPGQTPKSSPPPAAGYRALALFFMHVVSLLLAASSFLPLKLSIYAFKYSLRVSAFTFMYKIWLKNGSPKLRPFVAGIKDWLGGVMMNSAVDFQYIMLCLMFQSQRPISLVLVPPGTLAAYHASAHLYQQYSESRWWQLTLKRPHEFLRARQSQALTASAGAEVAIAGLLFVQVVVLIFKGGSPSALLMLICYFNYLKMRYMVPDP